MTILAIRALRTRYGSPFAKEYFAVHPVGPIVRSLFASCILWIIIAVAIYTVYSMIVRTP
jgi:uncharacterized membrane protein